MHFLGFASMAKKIRVMVVDDSAVMRRLLSAAIQSEPILELAGTAYHGGLALPLLQKLAPDIVTLDIEMPFMNGLETLKAIRATRPGLPVVMCSSVTVKGAEATVECLSLGASDYVTKPERVSNADDAVRELKRTLIPKLIALCSASPLSPVLQARTTPNKANDPPVTLNRSPVKIVAIGCSTGGPKALSEILPSIPADFSVPILVVQHMPSMFTGALAERLNDTCQLPAREALDGVELLPGSIWIARGDYHMEVLKPGSKVRLSTPRSAPENFCRPSVDVLFRSLAKVYASHVLAVVLTGMGQDGLRGCIQLSEAGAQIVVQDEDTSVVWGMPGFVARAGLAQAVLPLPQIGTEIVRRVQTSRALSAQTPLRSASPQWE